MKKYEKWKIQLMIEIDLRFWKNAYEKCIMFWKNGNIEIMIGKGRYKIITKPFEFLLLKYQIG